jgi:hypothetical protein
MTPREQLIAYLATLLAIVAIAYGAFIAAANGVTIGEAFALGTIFGGLIGVLRLPSTRSVTIDQPPGQPVPTEETRP